MTYSHENAIKAIKIQASRATELASKLNTYAEQMADTREVKAGTRMEWAINEIENFIHNIGFSSLAHIRADCQD